MRSNSSRTLIPPKLSPEGEQKFEALDTVEDLRDNPEARSAPQRFDSPSLLRSAGSSASLPKPVARKRRLKFLRRPRRLPPPKTGPRRPWRQNGHYLWILGTLGVLALGAATFLLGMLFSN